MSFMSDLATLVDIICEDRGYDSIKELEFDDLDYLAHEMNTDIATICAILRISSVPL